MCKGFIMLSRSFFENELWEVKRTYSDAEAWLDLIQLARFEDGERTVRIGKVEVVEKRGQVATTQSVLSDRWGRTVRSVMCFLKKLKLRGMITVDGSNNATVISLINYEKYNVAYQLSNTKTRRKLKRNDTTNVEVNVVDNVEVNVVDKELNESNLIQSNVVDNVEVNVVDNVPYTNKDNKDNNNSETSSNEDEKKALKKRYFVSTKTTVEDRRNDLWRQLQPFIPVFGAELVNDFFAYWSAPDKTGKDRMVIDDKRIKVFRIWDRLNTWLVKSNGKYEHNQKLAENGIKRSENDGSIVHTDVPANTRYISRWDAARQRADETNGRIADYIKRTLYPDADTVADSARDSPAIREGGQLCGDLQHPNGV